MWIQWLCASSMSKNLHNWRKRPLRGQEMHFFYKIKKCLECFEMIEYAKYLVKFCKGYPFSIFPNIVPFKYFSITISFLSSFNSYISGLSCFKNKYIYKYKKIAISTNSQGGRGITNSFLRFSLTQLQKIVFQNFFLHYYLHKINFLFFWYKVKQLQKPFKGLCYTLWLERL